MTNPFAHPTNGNAIARISVVDGVFVLEGDLLISTIEQLDLRQGLAEAIDLSRVHHLDTAGAWAVVSLERRLQEAGPAPLSCDPPGSDGRRLCITCNRSG